MGPVVDQQKGSGLIGQAERYPLSGREAGQFSAGKNSEARRNGDARRGKKGTQAQGRKTRCALQEVQGRKVGKVQDEAKCECEEPQGEYAYFSKSEVKESLTEKR